MGPAGRVAALLAALAALALPAAAGAHVTVLPAYLEDGSTATLVFSAPNERAPHTVTGLVVRLPRGVQPRRTAAPAGWRLDLADNRATWSGGRGAPGTIGRFPLRATAEAAPGGVVVTAVQHYDDGADVRWTVPLTILPGSGAHTPRQHLLRALVAGAIGLVAIAAGLAVVTRRSRRRS